MPTTPPISIATATDDRIVSGSHADTWASVAATGYTASGTTISARKRFDLASSADYAVDLALFRFNTGAQIPDNAVINSAQLQLYVTTIQDFDARSITADYFTWSGSNAAADWTVADLSGAMNPKSVASFTTNQVNPIDLLDVDANISKTGYTYIRLGMSGGQPAGFNTVAFASFDNTTSLPVPQLVVNYQLGEREAPTSVSGLTNLTGAVTDIDQDPDGTITDAGLVGSDPSSVPGSDGPEYVDTQALWTGSAAHTWTNVSNATDTSETTLASYALAANTTDYMDHWAFDAADWTSLPTDAVITGIAVTIRVNASASATRLSGWMQLASANNSLLGTEFALNGGVTLPTTAGGVEYTASLTDFGSPTITRAQLITGTFGVRTRFSRSNAVTAQLYSIKATVTYTASVTTNTQADVAMGDPTGTLAIGADTGEVRARMRKRGTGSDPSGQILVRQGGATVATLSAAPITDTSASGQLYTGTFDQDLVDSIPPDVTFRFVGTGAPGGLAELVAVEWVAQLAPPGVYVSRRPLAFY